MSPPLPSRQCMQHRARIRSPVSSLYALPTTSEMGGAPLPRLGRFIVRGARASGCKEGSEAEAGKVSEVRDVAQQ